MTESLKVNVWRGTGNGKFAASPVWPPFDRAADLLTKLKAKQPVAPPGGGVPGIQTAGGNASSEKRNKAEGKTRGGKPLT
jgi:hypothetical protein